MDAQTGKYTWQQYVADMAIDAMKSIWFGVVSIVVYLVFVPLFVYGLAVTVSGWKNSAHSSVDSPSANLQRPDRTGQELQ